MRPTAQVAKEHPYASASLSLSLSLSLSRARALSRSLSLSLSHTHIHTQTGDKGLSEKLDTLVSGGGGSQTTNPSAQIQARLDEKARRIENIKMERQACC